MFRVCEIEVGVGADARVERKIDSWSREWTG